MALTRYAEIEAGVGLLGRVTGALNATRKTEAETYAFRHVQGWLRRHLDDADDGFDLTAQERLDELETWWDGTSVDPLVADFAKVVGEYRYLQTQGHYDGKTGSPAFHAARQAREAMWEMERRLFEKGLLALSADESDYLVLRRFTVI